MSNSKILETAPPAVAKDAAAIPHRACPVCGSWDSAPVLQLELVVPETFLLQRSFSVNACARCGAIFHDVKPQPHRDSYYESYTGADTQEYPVSTEQARLNELTIGFLERAGLASADQAIADIGCSFGVTLTALQQRGFNNLYAMDPDQAAIRYLSRLGIPGRTGFATETFSELENSFDLVILRHVLEHLDFPVQAIDNVGGWLKPGGWIYIELPDLTRYQECGPFPGYFFEFEHINHFSLLSLLNLMQSYTLIQFESSSEIYPCIRALFEKSPAAKPLHRSAADAGLVERSFSQPSEAGEALLANIAALGNREIALWGVSVFVYRLLTHTPLKNCNICRLVDGNPQRQGETLLGLTIESPETLSSFAGDIVICGENSADSIERAARALGLDNNVVRLLRTAPPERRGAN